MDKSFLVLMHEFGVQRIESGFTKQDLINYLVKNGINLDDEWAEEKLGFLDIDMTFRRRNANGETIYFLSPESFYRHLGYLEMKSAQENAKKASRLGLVAIRISTVLAAIQIVVALVPFLLKGSSC